MNVNREEQLIIAELLNRTVTHRYVDKDSPIPLRTYLQTTLGLKEGTFVGVGYPTAFSETPSFVSALNKELNLNQSPCLISQLILARLVVKDKIVPNDVKAFANRLWLASGWRDTVLHDFETILTIDSLPRLKRYLLEDVDDNQLQQCKRAMIESLQTLDLWKTESSYSR